ncbi:MAG: hypothetical protein Fur0039_08470 [Rhodocyclaceae bacterium]
MMHSRLKPLLRHPNPHPALRAELRAAMKAPVDFRIAAATMLAIVLAAVLGYRFLPRADISLPLVEDCRLDRRACAVDGLPGGGRIEMAIEPRPAATARPLTLHVRLEGIRPDKVEVDFSGVEMNMGVTRLPLNAAGGGRYSAEVTLPVCVTGGMLWEAKARIDVGRRTISVPFRFETHHG